MKDCKEKEGVNNKNNNACSMCSWSISVNLFSLVSELIMIMHQVCLNHFGQTRMVKFLFYKKYIRIFNDELRMCIWCVLALFLFILIYFLFLSECSAESLIKTVAALTNPKRQRHVESYKHSWNISTLRFRFKDQNKLLQFS